MSQPLDPHAPERTQEIARQFMQPRVPDRGQQPIPTLESLVDELWVYVRQHAESLDSERYTAQIRAMVTAATENMRIELEAAREEARRLKRELETARKEEARLKRELKRARGRLTMAKLLDK